MSDSLSDKGAIAATKKPLARFRLDTTGWMYVRRQPWHKDRDYIEVWVSKDGHSWHMLGMERPRV